LDSQAPADYTSLTPDTLLDAVDDCGYQTDGHLLALNSYENRVYQVGVEDGAPVVVKFYRPARWDDAALLEEHAFSIELADRDLPVVAPLVTDGTTLHHFGPFRFAVYPQCGGRAPELDRPEHLRQLGRLVARLHAVGALKAFQHRPNFDIVLLGEGSRRYLIEHGFIPPHLQSAYEGVTDFLLAGIRAAFTNTGPPRTLRIHGDCHPGNILWTAQGPLILDLDDACTGPAMQDLWMFLSGNHDYMCARLAELLSGYSEFYDFDARELHLIEALRTLRMMNYAAWLARRWDDPAFPRAFPWFNTGRYWEEHVLTLREQEAALQEPVLEWREPTRR